MRRLRRALQSPESAANNTEPESVISLNSLRNLSLNHNPTHLHILRSQQVDRAGATPPQAVSEFFSESSGVTLHDANFTNVQGPQINLHQYVSYPTPSLQTGKLLLLALS